MKNKTNLTTQLLVTLFLTATLGSLGCGSTTTTSTESSSSAGSVSNAPSGTTFTDTDGNTITSFTEGQAVILEDTAGKTVFKFSPTADVDLTNVTAARDSSTSVVHFPASTDKTGISGSVTLSIPCSSSDTAVRVCPNATAASAVTSGCTGEITLTTSSPTSGNYTWANTSRSGSTDCTVTADIDNFGTGGAGIQCAFTVITKEATQSLIQSYDTDPLPSAAITALKAGCTASTSVLATLMEAFLCSISADPSLASDSDVQNDIDNLEHMDTSDLSGSCTVIDAL
jgi:hypothetical protein